MIAATENSGRAETLVVHIEQFARVKKFHAIERPLFNPFRVATGGRSLPKVGPLGIGPTIGLIDSIPLGLQNRKRPGQKLHCNLKGMSFTTEYKRARVWPVCWARTSSPNWKVAAGSSWWTMRQ